MATLTLSVSCVKEGERCSALLPVYACLGRGVNMMQLLEIALVDEMDKAPDLTHCNLALLMFWWTCYHLLPIVLVVMSLITTLNVVLKAGQLLTWSAVNV
ncbi:hypothetical protein Pyn_32014 [Prunus yedoensis var. nudiflora]|uniref:Uncharacterized protein n=1 Tax=Prunus yedoensis var. nudiflora TaxID=2094558 RepID=A0A315AGQ5_PRUYE|nr:hypothetical protein Pyn_32014 [Prunus yedoensis var. nudiflora]